MGVLSRVSKMAATTGLVAGLAFSGAAVAKELKLAHFVSPKHHLQVNVWEPLAADLAEASNGKLTLKIYPSGELGSGPAEQYNRVIGGVADVVHGVVGYTSALFPRTLLIELPGVPRSEAEATEGLWNALPLIEDEYRRVKLLALFANINPLLMTRDRQVRTPEDLKGLKIRVPSATASKVLAAWGATPVSMPISEVYNAAQTGVIDGVLLDGSSLNGFKLHEVFNNFTLGVPATTSAMFLVMNRSAYNSLSGEEKAAVDKVTGFELSKRSSQSYEQAHKKGMEMVGKMPGKTVVELTPEETARFDKLSRPLIDQAVADLDKRGVKNAGKVVEAMGKPYQQ
jgi:TRAP-type C4-dicarboxylate transport system substrate-binding protein